MFCSKYTNPKCLFSNDSVYCRFCGNKGCLDCIKIMDPGFYRMITSRNAYQRLDKEFESGDYSAISKAHRLKWICLNCKILSDTAAPLKDKYNTDKVMANVLSGNYLSSYYLYSKDASYEYYKNHLNYVEKDGQITGRYSQLAASFPDQFGWIKNREIRVYAQTIINKGFDLQHYLKRAEGLVPELNSNDINMDTPNSENTQFTQIDSDKDNVDIVEKEKSTTHASISTILDEKLMEEVAKMHGISSDNSHNKNTNNNNLNESHKSGQSHKSSQSHKPKYFDKYFLKSPTPQKTKQIHIDLSESTSPSAPSGSIASTSAVASIHSVPSNINYGFMDDEEYQFDNGDNDDNVQQDVLPKNLNVILDRDSENENENDNDNDADIDDAEDEEEDEEEDVDDDEDDDLNKHKSQDQSELDNWFNNYNESSKNQTLYYSGQKPGDGNSYVVSAHGYGGSLSHDDIQGMSTPRENVSHGHNYGQFDAQNFDIYNPNPKPEQNINRHNHNDDNNNNNDNNDDEDVNMQ